jgi:hypothetical protein
MVIFIGPSMPVEEARRVAPGVFAPPARMGDVYRAVRDGARHIGIVDGYYESVPAVWHKEILWALGSGARVYGAASMGALRAAELDRYGMIGVGDVYRWYRDGTLEDDDEVALLHAPASGGYTAASIPMVNIRATLAAAVGAGVLDRSAAQAIVTTVKALHYPERDHGAVLSAADRLDGSGALRRRLAAWLPPGTVDVKRRDAAELLRTMVAAYPGTDRRDLGCTPPFEPTWIWQELALTIDAARRVGGPATAAEQRVSPD